MPWQPCVGAVLALLVVGLAVPAGAAAEPLGRPPWWVSALRAAEKRFSPTFEVFSERQESLRIAAFDQFLEVTDPQTGEQQSFQLPGDPELLNRKFNLAFERQSTGPGVAITLPRVGFVLPTLTFDAALADVRLDFHDLTQAADSTSLRGRGALFDTRLDLVASPCRHCAWYTAAGYRFEKLPTLAVDRSPRFELQGFSVTTDEVRLGREVHEVSGRVGYAPPGARTSTFVGAQHRWTALEIEDRIAYRNPFSNDRLSSRTKLESEATLAVAGLDLELGPRWLGRLETAVGDGDWSAWLGVAFQPLSSGQPKERIRVNRIAREIARLRAELAGEAAGLPQVGWLAAAQALLDRYEQRFRALLPLPEFAALQSSVRYYFQRARERLAANGGARSDRRRHESRHSIYLAAAFSAAEPVAASSQSALDELLAQLKTLWWRFQQEDVDVHLCVESQDRAGIVVKLVPLLDVDRPDYWTHPPLPKDFPPGTCRFTTNESKVTPRGHYGYGAWRDGRLVSPCAGYEGCELDLLSPEHPFIVCTETACGYAPREEWWRCKRGES